MAHRPTGLLALTALLASLVTFPAAAADQPSTPPSACPDGAPRAPFTDVASDATHAAAIDCAAELGLISGRSADTFAPAADVTRGQVASIVVATLGHLGVTLPPLASSPAWPDAGTTHAEGLQRLGAAGIIQGYEDGTVRPGEPLTRAQFTALAVRTLAYVRNAEVSGERAGFGDVASDSTHAAAIDAAVEAGLFQGRSTDRFAPGETTRRDQAAAVAVRLAAIAGVNTSGEIWSLDQGTDLIHVYDAASEDELATIDVSPQALAGRGFAHVPSGDDTVPHMIEFDSQERFAFIAATAGAATIVIDTTTREVVEVLPTGAGSHMAAVTPDDSSAWVAAIGAAQMVEVVLDLDTDQPTFTIDRRLDVADLLADVEQAEGWEFPSYQPICHQYSTDASEAWVTLGPGWDQGGLFVLDLDDGAVSHAYDPTEVRANCGVSVNDTHAVANFSGQVVEGDDTPGETYVFDVDSKEQLHTIDARGEDTHGLRLNPGGSAYWQVNRISDDAIVIDATTFEVIAEYEDIADTPDILDFNADGSLLYVSQRGPNPLSGAAHAATGSRPGVAVIDTATGERLRVIEPDEVRGEATVEHPDGPVLNDIHGLAYRSRSLTRD